MAEHPETQRSQYPPPDDPNHGDYYGQGPAQNRGPPVQQQQQQPARDERTNYGSPQQEAPRQGQPYPDPRGPPQYPQQYPPHGYYPPQHHDPHYPAYQYPPPQAAGPPQPMQPDAYRLPPPHPPPGYAYPPYPSPYPQPPAPAPRQRTAIACKYCRKRKIRCSGYDQSNDGRCANCVRYHQQCLFHPVSSQATFVPASAVYGPNAARTAGQPPDGRANGYPPGEQPMLYGAHGQPLGPVGGAPQGQAPYTYPPHQNYGPAPYPTQGSPQYPGSGPGPGPGPQYDNHAQAPVANGETVSNERKRPLPDDDPRNEDTHTSQSPHPNSRPRNAKYDPLNTNSNGFDYPDPTNLAPTSPAGSTMSYQTNQTNPPPPIQSNGHAPANRNSPPSGLTPQSAHSFNSPRQHSAPRDGRTPPPQPGSAGSSANGRAGMSVHDMLGGPAPHAAAEQRARNDNDMLNKLDGKTK